VARLLCSSAGSTGVSALLVAVRVVVLVIQRGGVIVAIAALEAAGVAVAVPAARPVIGVAKAPVITAIIIRATASRQPPNASPPRRCCPAPNSG
jgi:hypothetical protein